jgi:branched-chain amino acid transport system ATP-binding protein
MSELLRLEDVSVAFGGVHALQDLSMTVQCGDVLGVIGPNGSGKTTLLNSILGYYATSAGDITFDGRKLRRELPHERIRLGLGRSFQHVGMFEQMTVEQVVLLGLRPVFHESFFGALLRTPNFRRIARAERERVHELLDALGMGEFAGKRMSELPYGARKMVDVARAVAGDPKLILLDEPSSGVSIDERREIVRLLAAIHADGATLLLIEHDMSIVSELSTRVIALQFGVKLAEGSFAEVLENETMQAIYFGANHAGAPGAPSTPHVSDRHTVSMVPLPP